MGLTYLHRSNGSLTSWSHRPGTSSPPPTPSGTVKANPWRVITRSPFVHIWRPHGTTAQSLGRTPWRVVTSHRDAFVFRPHGSTAGPFISVRRSQWSVLAFGREIFPWRPYGTSTNPPQPPVADTQVSGGGTSRRLSRKQRKRLNSQLEKIYQQRFGQQSDGSPLPEVARIVSAVAHRQAEDTDLDETQRIDELHQELEAHGVEWDSAYLTALDIEREELINREIGDRLRKVQNDRTVEMLLMLMLNE